MPRHQHHQRPLCLTRRLTHAAWRVALPSAAALTLGATAAPGQDATPTLTSAARPVTKTKSTITFVRSGDIYVMNANGAAERAITTDGAGYSGPKLSPDGTRILYSSSAGGTTDVYVMNADGTGAARLTQNAGRNDYPSWSPDGKRVAFSSDRDGDLEVYVMNADGTGATRLTTSTGADMLPAWSPDGTRIAFASDRLGSPNREIFVTNADGTNPVRLTTSTYGDTHPAWSPDGGRIAYTCDVVTSRNPFTMTTDICTVDVATQAVVNLTNTPALAESDPTWSPDGTRLAFQSNPNGAFDIFSVASTGGRPSQLTRNAADDRQPSWNR